MRISNVRLFLGILIGSAVLALSFAEKSATAAVVHPYLPEGSSYRVVFTTSGLYQSYNPLNPSQTRSLTYWDSIAASEKSASSDSVIANTIFHIVGAVFDGSVNQVGPTVANMSLSDNIPVYNTNGQLVAANSAAFWGANHLAGMNYDRDGNILTSNYWNAWHASLGAFRPYGHGSQTYFSNNATNVAPWAGAAVLGSANFLRSAAISEPILVVPEPSSIVIGSLGLLGLYAVSRRRKNA